MKILGIDVETTSLDTETCKVLEVGLCILDTDSKRITNAVGFLLKHEVDDNSEAIKINGLTQKILNGHGAACLKNAASTINSFMEMSDFVCAQNGNKFDKPIIERFLKEQGFPMPEKLWLDTKTDIEYPSHMKSNSLVPLAAYHGFLNPFPHNALFDVATMLTILSQYDINRVIERAKSPMVKIRAELPRELNHLLKARSYRWDPILKMWWKEIKHVDFEIEQKALPEALIKQVTILPN